MINPQFILRKEKEEIKNLDLQGNFEADDVQTETREYTMVRRVNFCNEKKKKNNNNNNICPAIQYNTGERDAHEELVLRPQTDATGV